MPGIEMFDRVRVLRCDATTQAGIADRIGEVVGHSKPSSSGVGPVVGDAGDDFAVAVAVAVSLSDDGDVHWVHPDLIEFVDRPPVEISLSGRTWSRDASGTWTERTADDSSNSA